MSEKPKKYTFVNGVMKLNPEYSAWLSNQNGVAAPSVQSESQRPIAILSSMDDVADASEDHRLLTGASLRLADTTVNALELMQDEKFTDGFSTPGVTLDGSALLDGLTEYFVKFEVPVGLINKLMELEKYHLKFIVDDSGSMNATTDSMLSEASEHVLRNGVTRDPKKAMTRWQEAETRLHNMIDILAYIPTKSIDIRFMNAKNIIVLHRRGKSTEEFTGEAHAEIANVFQSVVVRYKTPTLRVLTESFNDAALCPDPCMHYLLTDGVPSDSIVQQVSDLIKFRSSPERNPLTLISCTDEDEEVEWMKQVEEEAPFCAELDDYHGEKREVEKDQGTAFPYTRGYWLISQLVAAINPHDLDAIDENLPFTKHTLDNMLGRVHSPREYQYYFERNPHASLYLDVYERFLNEKTVARVIVSKHDQESREKGAGYMNGERMAIVIPAASLSQRLDRITAAATGAHQSDHLETNGMPFAIAYPVS